MDVNEAIEEIFTDDEKLLGHSQDIGKRICGNELKLVTVVETLGPKLTSKDVMDRCKAMNILSSILSSVSEADYLSQQELTFIVEFLHDRLKDQHLVIPKVVHCIRSIITSKNLPEGAAKKLLIQLFKEANIQSHVHKDRHAFFLILNFILDDKLEEIKDLGSDFVMYFIQSMDGEKDPRNLLLLFRCVPTVLNNFPLGPFVEDAFEVLSCYFPIDFTPMTTTPNAEIITRDNLANALHICLSHTNEFTPFLVPLILEKLTSNVLNAKLDALRLLEMCCKRSYLAEDLEPSLPAIWAGLRNEIFMGGNDAVISQCMHLISAAFAMFSKSPIVLKNSVNLIFAELKHHLMEPEMRLMQPTSSVLLAIAESAEPTCETLTALVLPLLYEQFLAKSSSSERKSLLGFLAAVVSTTRKFPNITLGEIVGNWDEILATWFTLLSHSDQSFVNLSLGFFTMILSSDLDTKSLQVLQFHILNLLSLEKSFPSENTKRLLFNCLETLAYHFPDSLNETTIPGLLNVIESSSTSLQSDFLARIKLILSAIAECSYLLKVAEKVVPFLLDKISQEEKKAEKAEKENIDGSSNSDSEVLRSLLSCLARIIEKGCRNSSTTVPVLNTIQPRTPEEVLEFSEFVCVKLNVVQIMTDLAIRAGKRLYQDKNNFSHPTITEAKGENEVFVVSTDIIRDVVRSSSERNQTSIINRFWNEKADQNDDSVQDIVKIIPGLLLESLISPVRRSVKISKRTLLMDQLVQVILYSDTDLDKNNFAGENTLAQIRLFANLLNKLDSTDELKRFEERILNLLNNAADAVVNGGAGDNSPALNGDSGLQYNLKTAVTLFVWVMKSLALRGVDTLDSWLDKAIQLLEKDRVGPLLSESFEVLMEDCPTSLNAESFCNYRFLYKQRLFLLSVPRFVSAYKTSRQDSPSRVNYIRAISAQLRYVPNTVLHMVLNNVLPLLVASIICVDSSAPIRLSSLTALYDLLNDKSNADTPKDVKDSPLCEYYHDVVPHLVKMAAFKENMDIRIMALRCLQKCSKFPSHMVIKEKSKVVEDLKPVLNDHKRLVRKEAVITRNIWILTGAPGGL